MDSDTLFPLISFIIAFVFGFLTWIAKEVWVDKGKTQTFAAITVIATLAFMYWTLVVSDW